MDFVQVTVGQGTHVCTRFAWPGMETNRLPKDVILPCRQKDSGPSKSWIPYEDLFSGPLDCDLPTSHPRDPIELGPGAGGLRTGCTLPQIPSAAPALRRWVLFLFSFFLSHPLRTIFYKNVLFFCLYSLAQFPFWPRVQ